MRIRRILKWGLALLAGVVLVAAVLLAGGYLWLRSSGLPQRSGEARLGALRGAATVRWDRWGVPHVEAGSGRDLAAVLGYLHANDRFTQMELGRRMAAGRLAELFGESLLPRDRHFRTVRLRRSAETQWRAVTPETRGWLLAYAEGVNAWLAERADDLPPELELLGVEPEPWTAVDSLSFAMLLAHNLSFWQGLPEDDRFLWLSELGAGPMADLVGERLEVPGAVARLARQRRTAAARDGPAAEPAALGSNNWALGVSRTATGAPLVANDPHLPLGLPCTWYQVLLRAPDFEAAGMTIPGLPVVVVGQSAKLAWSLTHAVLDDHDLFYEELDGSGTRVRRGEAWVPVRTEEEEIRLRGGGGGRLTLRATEHGPLLEADAERGLPARSLAWTALAPTDPLISFLRLGRAATVAEVRPSLEPFTAPAQSLVVADASGGLLFTVLGRVPRRRAGDGRFPAQGRDVAYGWDGLVPQAENPTVIAPAEDLLVTANNDIRPPGYTARLAADFDTPHRAERIRRVLLSRPRWRADELAGLQGDVVSLHARRVVELLAGSYQGDAAAAHAALAAWDGAMELRGPSALFALAERQLSERIFGDEARRHRINPFASRDRLVRVLEGRMSPAWFDDVETPEKETRQQVLSAALAAAWRATVERWGEDPERWSYGELHSLTLQHPVGALPLLGRWLNRGPRPVPGSAATVAAFAGPWQGDRQQVASGPGMRWIADLGDPGRSLAGVLGGQSGHPEDPHYDDQLDPFLRGEMHRVAWSPSAIERATVSRLRLTP